MTDPLPKDDRGLAFCANKAGTWRRPQFRYVLKGSGGGPGWALLSTGYLMNFDAGGSVYSGPCRWQGDHVMHSGNQFFGGFSTIDGEHPYNESVGLLMQNETLLIDIAYRMLWFPAEWSDNALTLPFWFSGEEAVGTWEPPDDVSLIPIPFWDDVTRRFPDVL